MKNYLYILLLILLISSCSPQKRLHRLVKKHPELSRVDTIKIQDTVIVPGIKTDTVFSSSLLHDTVTITKENLQIKLIEINDTIYLNANVKADTVIIEREILVDRIIHVEPKNKLLNFFKNIKTYFTIVIILIIVLTLLYKGLNR